MELKLTSFFQVLLLITVVVFDAAPTIAQPSERPTSKSKALHWHTVAPGFQTAEYTLQEKDALIDSNVLLLKFSQEKFSFVVGVDEQGTNIRRLTDKLGGVAGINGSFYDPDGKPLGLIIQKGRKVKNVHRGGSLLTGIFYVENNRARIVHRSDFSEPAAEALQSGPRLIVDGRAVEVRSPHVASRRSGIAITRSNEILLYATYVRFPGASFAQIQSMLLDPRIDAVDALNLDGGGSSQVYVAPEGDFKELFISGGDKVPVGIIVKRKT